MPKLLVCHATAQLALTANYTMEIIAKESCGACLPPNNVKLGLGLNSAVPPFPKSQIRNKQ
jgi:hypothetical protein